MRKQQVFKTATWSEEQIEEFHRVYALRSQLAGFAARQAAARVHEGQSCTGLRDAYAKMHETARRNDYAAFLNADMQFHRSIAELAAVPALVEIWKQLEQRMKTFAGWAHRCLYRDLQMIAQAHEAHFQAIVSGNGEAAERAAHLDLDSLWQMLSEQPAETSDENDPVERACAYILLNLHRKITLEKIARDAVHLSASHFNKLFRQRRGQSVGQYIQNLRLQRAESLLREGMDDIHELAARVGYADASRFSEHFKRRYGCAPSKYSPRNP